MSRGDLEPNGGVRVEFEVVEHTSDKHGSTKSLNEACTRRMKILEKFEAGFKSSV